MDKLIILQNDVPVREVELGEVTTIGRHQDCVVQLEHPQISRLHAVLTRSAGGQLLQDRGSMNGTYLNDRRLTPKEEVEIRAGDVMRIQTFALRFERGGGRDLAVSSAATGVAPLGDGSLQALDQPPSASILLAHLLERRGQFPVWSKGDLELQVADIIDETPETKTFRLVGKTDTLFSYKPGQFVTLEFMIDGAPVRRSYSISSSPSRPHTLELTVKRVPGGLVSNWMADRLALGDTVSVRGPAGKFSCFNYPARKMLCIAAGSGITPIMSMLRWIVDTTADVDVVLLYSAQSPAGLIFRKELEHLSARHSSLRVLFTLTSKWSGTESWTGLVGRIDPLKLQLAAPDLLERHVFLCGPKPFSEAVKAQLKDLSYPLANLHTESFGVGRVADATPPVVDAAPAARAAAPVQRRQPAPAVPDADAARAPSPAPPASQHGAGPAASSDAGAEEGFVVRFARSGREARAGKDTRLLDLAEMHGVEIDYACREGSCGSCKTKCVSGDVHMLDNDLSDEERAQGWVYPCVACAQSDVVLEV